MPGYYDFNEIINSRLNALRSYIDNRPLVLGAATASGGGTAGRPGGFIGVLPQTKIAFDLSEAAVSGIPASGASLLDNLNRIRYRIEVLEAASGTAGPGTITIKEGDIVVASGITVLDFQSGFSVNESPTGEVNIAVTASGAGEINTASNVNIAGVGVFKQKSGVDLQFKGVNAGSSKITVTDDTGNNEIDIDLGTVNLGDLSNVVGTPVVSGQSLVFQGTNWRPATISGGGGGATVLNDLTDVNTAGVSDGQVIAYDSGTQTWLPTTISGVVGGGGVSVGAKVYHNTAQDVSDQTDTTLSFNSEYWDTDTIHDTSTNNSRLTCKTAGKYLIIGQVQWNTGGTNDRVRINKIKLNGTTTIAQTTNHVTSTVYGQAYVASVIYDLQVDDYVELVVWQNSGSTRQVAYTANHSPDFSMHLLSSASSGTASLTIKDNNVFVASGISVLDFGTGLSVTESPTGEINITASGGGGAHNPVTVVDTSTVDLTLTDQQLEARVIFSGVNHDQLLNTHNLTTDIDHTTIQNIGTNTHAQIDTHIADTTIHFDELGELANVNVGAAVSGQVLKFIGTNWIPANVSGGGGSPLTVKDAGAVVSSDVTVLDFVSGFGVTESPAGEINLTVTVSGGGLTNLDGGVADSNYGSITAIDGGTA